MTFIAEFLRGFDKSDSSGTHRKGVNLEKLGQYLRREPLQIVLSTEGSEWASLVDENRCLHDHPLIIKQDLNSSLLQSHGKLVEAITGVFSEAYKGLLDYFNVTSRFLAPFEASVSTQIVSSTGHLLLAATNEERKVLRIFSVDAEQREDDDMEFKSTLIAIDNRQGK